MIAIRRALVIVLAGTLVIPVGSVTGGPAAASTGPVVVVAPAIAGAVQVGAVLTATPGQWNPTPTSFAYQWAANDVAIDGATGARFIATPEVQGTTLTVTVTASTPDATSAATSAPTKVVSANPWTPVGFPAGVAPVELSCTPAGLCFTLANNGEEGPLSLLAFDGTRWTTIRSFSQADVGSMDCATDGFCLLIAGEYGRRRYQYLTFSDGSWSSPRPMGLLPNRRNGKRWTGVLREVTCVSRAFCAAELGGHNTREYGGSGGFLIRYVASRPTKRKVKHLKRLDLTDMLNFPTRRLKRNPWRHTKWLLPRNVTKTGHLHTLACSSPTSCLVQDAGSAKVGVFNGKKTKNAIRIGDRWGEVALDCMSPSLCVAGEGHAWAAQQWMPIQGTDADLYNLGCNGVGGCFGLGTVNLKRQGVYENYPVTARLDSTRWDVAQVVTFEDPRGGSSNGVYRNWPGFIDCPSTDYCVAVGDGVSFVYRATGG